MTKTSLKQDLLAVIHWFHAKGWAPATSTNYSFRNPKPGNNTYTISRSGVDKGLFQIADFMEVDASGKALEDFKSIKPSAETLLHTMLYAEKPAVQAILHTHSVVNTACSWIHRTNKSLTLEGFELLKGIAGITTHEASIQLPIFENSQDMQALSAEIREGMAKCPGVPGFLLAGHGLYAWGSSLAEAKRHIEVFEFLMECLLLIEKR